MAGKIGTMMVVDDERFDLECAKRVLRRSGIVERIICFGYPGEALDFLRRTDRPAIDIILLDINMPRLSGFDFLERASGEIGPNIAKAVVVMLTTSLAPADIRRAEVLEIIKDYIPKPLLQKHIHRLYALLEAGHTPEAN